MLFRSDPVAYWQYHAEIGNGISGYFDIEEAARYTRLSTSTLYHDKTVPCYKAGEKLVFVKDELDTWLRSRRR